MIALGRLLLAAALGLGAAGCGCGQPFSFADETAFTTPDDPATYDDPGACLAACATRYGDAVIDACAVVDSTRLIATGGDTGDTGEAGDTDARWAVILHCEGHGVLECE